MASAVIKTAVIVENPVDHRLIERMLGINRCHFYVQYKSFEQSTDRYDVVIVCHRKSVENPTPRIPTQYQPLRMIVVSDCTNEEHIVSMLQSGAHHYINWQDSEYVMTARLAAALRWHTRSENRVLDVNPFKFQVVNRSVFRNERRIDLSPREFELAYYLFTNRDRVILDSELLTSVWTLPSSMDTRRIDTAICRIRHKLGLQLASSQWSLVRLRRQGYRLTCRITQSVDEDVHA